MRSSDTGLTRPQVFSRLPFGDGGLLAFQGLSRGLDLLMVVTTRQSERDRPCRPGGTVKSTSGVA